MAYLGDYPVDATAYIYFDSFDANGASASITGLAVTDIEIYKNGSITQRASDAGYTLLDTDGIDFDALVGINGFSIDLSNDTDAGFYAAGGEYVIVVSSVTLESQTVSFIAGTFSIERTGGALALLKGTNSLANIKAETALIVADTNELQTDDVPGLIAALNNITAASIWAVDATGEQTQGTFGQAIGDPGVDADTIYGAVVTGAAGANISVDLISVKSTVDNIENGVSIIIQDTNELQTDDVPGLIAALNDIAATDIVSAGAITTLSGAVVNVDLVDVLTTYTGNTLQTGDTYSLANGATGFVAIDTVVDAILVDTGTTLQAELDAIQAAVITNAAGVDVAADIIALKAETALIVADTNELQTDDVPTLISTLDGVVDTVKAETALIVADTNELQTDWADGGRLDVILDAVSAPTAAAVADAVWDEAQSAHVISGSFGIIASEIADILIDTGTTIPATLTVISADIATTTSIAASAADTHPRVRTSRRRRDDRRIT
ncbi:hypothetical protein LCGC14_0551860 [marine sediment metagenome]|uniref:Uncharacterized protein n=1 Tax=marine sediment metagenome TaxID=412755 RepID=A0A0F9RUN3_9ZZZZ